MDDKTMHKFNDLKIRDKSIHWSTPERAIVFQLVFILFERYFIQLGAPSAIIYIIDLVNIYLLLNLFTNAFRRQFSLFFLSYAILIGFSLCIAVVNFSTYGNNLIFSILEIRNLIRFLIFFLAVANYMKIEHVDRVFSVIELHFFMNSAFIVLLWLTYFPPTALWMRGDLLNGFFGNLRGGNTFVNVEMLIVVLYIFVKWTKKKENLAHVLLVLGVSMIIASLIELKAFFIEIVAVYFWYLLCVKKTKKEKQLNIIIIVIAVVIAYIAIQIMSREYPWFADTLTFKGLVESFSSTSYSSADDLNRFTGFFTISDRMFHGNIIEILFGIGLGNGAASKVAGHTTTFASMYANSNYSWFQGTYLFVQCGLLGLVTYLYTFILLFVKKKSNEYKTFSNMMILLAMFLIFYGEALKTDAGYFVYFSIATGFLINRREEDKNKAVKTDVDIGNNTNI